MNTYIKIIVLFLIATFVSCEDVIDVPVQTAATRLVIEASLDWEKGSIGNEQSIRLRTSTPFFDTEGTTAVSGASVTVTDNTVGTLFIFEDQNNGEYRTLEFVPVIGHTYTLEILHNGETYAAQEELFAIPEITEIFQDTEDGFDDEAIEVHVVFNDPPEEGNNYFFKFQQGGDLFPELEVGDDKFVNGNEIDWWYEAEEDEETDEIEALEPGDEVFIEMYGISNAYNDYMEILIGQIGGVGLFEATPIAVKGNCINRSNPDNYAHGYFRVTEFNRASYTIE